MRSKLFYPDWFDVTPAVIEFEGEISKDFSPDNIKTWEGKVNFSETHKRIQDKDGRWVQLSGIVHVKGDILGGIKFTRATCTIAGNVNRNVVAISQPRNPDGSINHTRLELI